MTDTIDLSLQNGAMTIGNIRSDIERVAQEFGLKE